MLRFCVLATIAEGSPGLESDTVYAISRRTAPRRSKIPVGAEKTKFSCGSDAVLVFMPGVLSTRKANGNQRIIEAFSDIGLAPSNELATFALEDPVIFSHR